MILYRGGLCSQWNPEEGKACDFGGKPKSQHHFCLALLAHLLERHRTHEQPVLPWWGVGEEASDETAALADTLAGASQDPESEPRSQAAPEVLTLRNSAGYPVMSS